MRIDFDIIFPSLNKYVGFNGWKIESGVQKKFLSRLKDYEILGLKEPKKMILSIYIYNSRKYDEDNLHGGAKPLIDALKKKRLIWDDRPEFLVTHYFQIKCKRGEEKTTVILEEYPNK